MIWRLARQDWKEVILSTATIALVTVVVMMFLDPSIAVAIGLAPFHDANTSRNRLRFLSMLPVDVRRIYAARTIANAGSLWLAILICAGAVLANHTLNRSLIPTLTAAGAFFTVVILVEEFIKLDKPDVSTWKLSMPRSGLFMFFLFANHHLATATQIVICGFLICMALALAWIGLPNSVQMEGPAPAGAPDIGKPVAGVGMPASESSESARMPVLRTLFRWNDLWFLWISATIFAASNGGMVAYFLAAFCFVVTWQTTAERALRWLVNYPVMMRAWLILPMAPWLVMVSFGCLFNLPDETPLRLKLIYVAASASLILIVAGLNGLRRWRRLAAAGLLRHLSLVLVIPGLLLDVWLMQKAFGFNLAELTQRGLTRVSYALPTNTAIMSLILIAVLGALAWASTGILSEGEL